MRAWTAIIVFLLNVYLVEAIEVKVNLFADKLPAKELVFRIQGGAWGLKEIPSARINTVRLVRVKWVADGLQILQGENKWLVNRNITIVPLDSSANPVLDIFLGEKDLRRVTGQVHVQRLDDGISLTAHLPLEDYVAGVVEAEVGHVGHVEFLAAQAVVARSYALAKMSRANSLTQAVLSDGTSDQVFRGIPWGRNRDSIFAAVKETEGWVLTTLEGRWFPVVFHSNSGGETVPSEDAWSQVLPELRSVKDTFSTNGPHARWTTRISCALWEGYLLEKLGDSLAVGEVEAHWHKSLDNRSQRYISCEDKVLDAVHIRRQFGLSSTWFQIQESTSDTLVLSGLGFGHGVGMSQEGAMVMAVQGFSWSEILLYYYSNVKLQHLSQLKRL